MGLQDILLSLLREPMSGTELIHFFRGTIHHFWQTDLSQIYRALEALDREGYVRAESMPSSKGPARKEYRLTKKGRTRLAGWLRQKAVVPPHKFEYLAKIFSVTADAHPRKRALELMRSMRGEVIDAVVQLEAIEHLMSATPGFPNDMPANMFYPWLTLHHGLMRRRALLEWIDESIVRIERRSSEADNAGESGCPADLQRMLEDYRAETEPFSQESHRS